MAVLAAVPTFVLSDGLSHNLSSNEVEIVALGIHDLRTSAPHGCAWASNDLIRRPGAWTRP